MIYHADKEIATITRSAVNIRTIADVEGTRTPESITFALKEIEKGGYEHFMLKEINEQSATVKDAMRGRIRED